MAGCSTRRRSADPILRGAPDAAPLVALRLQRRAGAAKAAAQRGTGETTGSPAMAVTTEPASAPFQLSMLIYDRRYRSITIQVAALIGVIAAFAWLAWNTKTNLELLGKDFDFSFLGNRAGFDINQTPIPYSSDSSYGRAAMVGLINTLLVAFFGCILATVIGVLVGVLRLSKNWLTAVLMSVYVESLRNVPAVIWIFLLFLSLTLATPAPNAFRGENPTASMWLNDSIAITNRGTYIPRLVFEPAAWGLLAVFVASVIAIVVIRRRARLKQEQTGAQTPVFWIGLGLLIVPQVIAYFLLGQPVSLSYPELRGFNFQGGFQLGNSFVALWFALSLYTGAFIAENVRAGIMAISKGQTEAAYSLGLKPGRTMNLVILPQALRVIIPPLISQYLNLTKNTSLGIAASYMDLSKIVGGITLNQTGKALECVLLMMAIYLTISLLISAGMNWYNKSTKLKER
jgi:general L-amino acid transport system permease protein